MCEKAMALDDNAQEAKERLDQNYYSTKKKVITKVHMQVTDPLSFKS